MHKIIRAASFIFVWLISGSFMGQAADRPPNILLVLTDDQGWPTLGCYGSKQVPTPHLDRLASDGVRFTSAYVTPQCTPTRAALLTGQHPARSRMWHVIPWYGTPFAPVREPAFVENMPRASFTLASGLRDAGYATACLGKWHLTTNEDGNYVGLKPVAAKHYGFDEVNSPGPGSQNEGDKHVDHLTDEAIAFMTKHRDRPWFCYLAHHTLHGVVSAPSKLIEKHRKQGAPATGLHNATYLAAIEHLDNSVGRLLGALDKEGQREQTLVIFLSDNGGVSYSYDIAPYRLAAGREKQLRVKEREFDNSPLRATKGTLYEGGVRVPCIVSGPGVTRGNTCDTPIQALDWLPTLLKLAGSKLPAGLNGDGADITPLFTKQKFPDRSLYWYAPLYDLRWGATPAAAIRRGSYKLIEYFGDSFGPEGLYRPGRRIELYDLDADLGETNDLAAAKPKLAAELEAELHQFLKSTGAELPGPNPAHDPERPFYETNIKPH
jgi:arylsulfatase A